MGAKSLAQFDAGRADCIYYLTVYRCQHVSLGRRFSNKSNSGVIGVNNGNVRACTLRRGGSRAGLMRLGSSGA